MGESTDGRATLQFDRRLRLEFHGATITSDAGLLACRELDEALELTEAATTCLQESRGGRNVQHQLVALLRQSVYSRLAGYEDTNDAERLAQDPAMRVIVGPRGSERQAASTNTMSRFETEVLTQDRNLEGLARLNAQWVDRAMAHTAHRRVILDMDSSESPVHGEQEGAAYNGHFGSVCYHPLFVFNQFGDCEGAMLRPGNVHSADNWREVLDPILARYERTQVRRYFRADAAFAKPKVYEYLEERRVLYAIRLPSNEVLQWEIARLLGRPVGRPPKKPIVWYDDFWYQAGSWDRARRVVAKVEWHQGELFPRVGFIVTNMSASTEGVVNFYNGRGTAEQWIKEGKYALNWTRLSCHRFVANQVRLALFILAYNLGNFLRRLCLPVTEATEENGCLVVGRRSHTDGLGLHCYTGSPEKQGIPQEHRSGEQVPLPMKPGDVLFMTKLTMHASLPNVSDEIRWSFDLRYNPTGEATGRRWFPGFVARSRSNPDSELHDADIWAQRWRDTRAHLAQEDTPGFQRWDPNDPQCA